MTHKPREENRYRLSIAGIAAYITLWATIFAAIRVLAKYSSIGAEGSYSRNAGLLTDFGLPITIGLVLVAIGISIAFSIGKIRHAWTVVVSCFLIGFFSLPMLWVTIIGLALLGIIDLD